MPSIFQPTLVPVHSMRPYINGSYVQGARVDALSLQRCNILNWDWQRVQIRTRWQDATFDRGRSGVKPVLGRRWTLAAVLLLHELGRLRLYWVASPAIVRSVGPAVAIDDGLSLGHHTAPNTFEFGRAHGLAQPQHPEADG